MDHQRRDWVRKLAIVAGAGSLNLHATHANAQAYPNRPIRIVVPYAAGGTSDILSRTLAVRVGEALGQQFIVDNKPGANGVLGSDLVAKAPADGYTLLLTDLSGLTTSPALMPNMPFNPTKDLAPVTMISYSPHLLLVPPDLPVKSVAELVAYAKQKAGSLNVATVGAGSATHLAGAMFAQMAGLNWAYIPYKGGGQSLNDVASGQAQVTFNGMLASLPYVKSNRLKLLAVTSDKRWPSLPDTPTVAELGYPGFLTGSFQGLMAPANTPADVIARLNSEFTKALSAPDVSERLIAQGAEPRPMSPDKVSEFLRADTIKWTKLIKDTGIKVE